MLDDDDDVDDDNSYGVSGGDGDVLAMMALLPTGRANSSGPWLPLCILGERWLREVRNVHAAGSGRSRFFVCSSYVVCSAAVAVSSLLSSVSSSAVVVLPRDLETGRGGSVVENVDVKTRQ